jgi:glucan phosphoethanolaminetransferase (alkaline phosphatase superfamily)
MRRYFVGMRVYLIYFARKVSLNGFNQNFSMELIRSIGGNRKYFLFSCFTALFISVVFSLASYIHLPISRFTDIFLFFVHWCLVALGSFVFCYLIALWRWLFLLVYPLLIFVCAIISFFTYSQNLSLTTSVIDASLHNDLRTSIDLVSPGLVLFVLFSLGVAVLFVRQRIKAIKFRFRFLEVFFVLVLGFMVIQVNELKNNSVWQRLPFSIYYVGKQYLKQIRENDHLRKMPCPDAFCKTDSLVVVFVIGEAARADHFQLNGYKRETNRFLSKIPVISYPFVFSPWTHTNSSLPHILTRTDSLGQSFARNEKSFVSVFNHCNYHTFWIANQEPAASYFPFVKEARTLFYANPAASVYNFNKKWLDTDILPWVDKALAAPIPLKLIVVHSIGSHWYYNDHFNDDCAFFKPLADSKIISLADKQKIINSYDNTLVFTDFFLNELIKKLQNKRACLFYLADHGESLGENGKWLHAQDNQPEKRPACLFWLSDLYRRDFPEKFSALSNNKFKTWQSHFAFHTLLGLGEIETRHLDKKNDASQKQ